MPGVIKAISLWQPWATLVILGVKRFETRGKRTNYRGPLLIHAAQRNPFTASDDIHQLLYREPFCSVLQKLQWKLPLGCLLGMVNVDACYQVAMNGKDIELMQVGNGDIGRPVFAPLPTGDELAFGNYAVGRYAWKFSNPRAFENPIDYKGSQGIFHVPAGVVADQMKRGAA